MPMTAPPLNAMASASVRGRWRAAAVVRTLALRGHPHAEVAGEARADGADDERERDEGVAVFEAGVGPGEQCGDDDDEDRELLVLGAAGRPSRPRDGSGDLLHRVVAGVFAGHLLELQEGESQGDDTEERRQKGGLFEHCGVHGGPPKTRS
jgi:hypothetical protein